MELKLIYGKAATTPSRTPHYHKGPVDQAPLRAGLRLHTDVTERAAYGHLPDVERFCSEKPDMNHLSTPRSLADKRRRADTNHYKFNAIGNGTPFAEFKIYYRDKGASLTPGGGSRLGL